MTVPFIKEDLIIKPSINYFILADVDRYYEEIKE